MSRLLLATLLGVALADCSRTSLPNTPVSGVDDGGDSDQGGDDSLSDDPIPVEERESDLLVLLADHNASLVGYWKFEGDFSDAGPLGNDLEVFTGSPTFQDVDPAVGEHAAAFYDDSLVLTNRESLMVDAFSYSVWVFSDLLWTQNSNSSHGVFKLTDGGSEISSVFFLTLCNTEFRSEANCAYGNVKIPQETVGDVSVDAYTWHHLAGSVGLNGAHHYLDGVPYYDDATPVTSVAVNGTYLVVAQLWPPSPPLYNPQYIHGNIDDFAIWNIELTGDEIVRIFENQRR